MYEKCKSVLATYRRRKQRKDWKNNSRIITVRSADACSIAHKRKERGKVIQR
jgi:hypothetical protein